MYGRSLFTLVAVMSFVGFVGEKKARAVLPPDRVAEFVLHVDPEDPESAVEFVVGMRLKAADSDGDYIGWEVEEIRIKRFDSEGTKTDEWSEPLPSLDTTDGLWWILHADPGGPSPKDFVLPPPLEGVATPGPGGTKTLAYVLEGKPYTPPPGGVPYSTTAALGVKFTLQGDTVPIEDEPEEPADVPDGAQDPE